MLYVLLLFMIICVNVMFICICLIEVEMKIIFFVKVICNYCLKYVYNKKDNIRIFVLNFWKFKNIKNYLMYCYLNFKKKNLF